MIRQLVCAIFIAASFRVEGKVYEQQQWMPPAQQQWPGHQQSIPPHQYYQPYEQSRSFAGQQHQQQQDTASAKDPQESKHHTKGKKPTDHHQQQQQHQHHPGKQGQKHAAPPVEEEEPLTAYMQPRQLTMQQNTQSQQTFIRSNQDMLNLLGVLNGGGRLFCSPQVRKSNTFFHRSDPVYLAFNAKSKLPTLKEEGESKYQGFISKTAKKPDTVYIDVIYPRPIAYRCFFTPGNFQCYDMAQRDEPIAVIQQQHGASSGQPHNFAETFWLYTPNWQKLQANQQQQQQSGEQQQQQEKEKSKQQPKSEEAEKEQEETPNDAAKSIIAEEEPRLIFDMFTTALAYWIDADRFSKLYHQFIEASEQVGKEETDKNIPKMHDLIKNGIPGIPAATQDQRSAAAADPETTMMQNDAAPSQRAPFPPTIGHQGSFASNHHSFQQYPENSRSGRRMPGDQFQSTNFENDGPTTDTQQYYQQSDLQRQQHQAQLSHLRSHAPPPSQDLQIPEISQGYLPSAFGFPGISRHHSTPLDWPRSSHQRHSSHRRPAEDLIYS